MSSIAALHTSTFALGFSNNERQAAARALLRHDAHIDGTHYQTRKLGGLHPSYIGFNATAKQTHERALSHDALVEAVLQDMFDALTIQDRLDGGISVLVRCAGSEATATTSPEQLPIDVYITPRELCESAERIGGDVVVWVQVFAQEFVIPHLQHFNKHCLVEDIKPQRQFPASHISSKGPQHLPAPMVATGARIQCSAQAAQVFSGELKASTGHIAPSAAIREAADIGKKNAASVPSTPQKQTMVLQSFYTKKRSRRVQVPPHTRPKVTLSKEARTALKLQRNEKSRRFKDALDAAWNQIDDATKTIATSHHKSICCVQNDLYLGRGLLRLKCSKVNLWNTFCWKKSQDVKKDNSSGHGKDVLQSLVRDNKAEYHALSEQEQEALLKEYADEKQTRATGTRVSTKSKVNDITQTLKAIEIELHSLNCRTGAEVMLYMTRGSTDLPLRGITFTTDGVQNFMASVMGIDTQDLVSKMEGFSIQGVRGAAKNHQQHTSQVHGAIRDLINCGLLTGEPRTKMQWAYYFCNVVQFYQVAIEGWPDRIPFTNLSQVSSALPDLEMLLRKWETGATCWKVLNDEEFEQLRRERNDQLERGEIIDHCRRTRSDKGSKRQRHPTAADNSRSGKKTTHKSKEIIESSDEEEVQPDSEDQLPTPSNTPASSNIPVPDPSTVSSLSNMPFNAGSDTMPYDPVFDADAVLAHLDELFGPDLNFDGI
ncbi:hypothetical protein EV702DRAFT_1202548 [Suillus placidus]|uniref:Uncharacterized protein n=1 Tax=Suillus placidus TaxID=48579 RepID=A0A9P6ZKK6_9AGAM|nr:hypothetical protein EV702DRAFT_1202548 [Suillus placidus]